MAHSPVQRTYDHAAARYHTRWARYTARSLDMLRPHIPARPRRVLDVGCGTGALLRALADWDRRPGEYLGLDLSAGMLRAVRSPEAGLVQGSAVVLPVADAAFDLVVSVSSFHDWPDPAAALIEMRRAVAPDGRLLLADWCADYTSIRLMRTWLRLTGRAVAQVYTAEQLRTGLEHAGFRVLSVDRRRISAVWGMMLAEAVPT